MSRKTAKFLCQENHVLSAQSFWYKPKWRKSSINNDFPEKKVIRNTKFPEGVKSGKFICFFLKMDVKRTFQVKL